MFQMYWDSNVTKVIKCFLQNRYFDIPFKIGMVRMNYSSIKRLWSDRRIQRYVHWRIHWRPKGLNSFILTHKISKHSRIGSGCPLRGRSPKGNPGFTTDGVACNPNPVKNGFFKIIPRFPTQFTTLEIIW